MPTLDLDTIKAILHLDDLGLGDLIKAGPLHPPSATEIGLRQEAAARQLEAQRSQLQKDMEAQAAAAYDMAKGMGFTINRSKMPTTLSNPPPFDLHSAAIRKNMICMRLRVDPERMPFDAFATMYANEVVWVSVVMRGQGVMLQDPGPEFPSDTLMAQLRLLL